MKSPSKLSKSVIGLILAGASGTVILGGLLDEKEGMATAGSRSH